MLLPDPAVLAGLADAVPLYLATFTSDRRYVYVNTRYAGRFGLQPAELVGRHLRDVIGDAAMAALEPYIAQVLAGHAVSFERAFDYGWAQPQTLRTTLTPRRDASGAVIGWYGAAENVTEAKRVEARLLAEATNAESLLLEAVREKELSLQRFRELADSLPQIVWSVNADGEHDYFNQRFYDLMGVAAGVPIDPWASLHPDDARRLAGLWQHALETGEPFEQEFRLAFAGDGVYRWYLGRTVPVRDGDGRIVRWYGTSTEIQEQKQAAEALELNRARLRAALDASDTGTFRWDIETNALDWDTNLKRLFGLPNDAPVAVLDDFLGRVHPDDRAAVVAACERCVADGLDFQQEFRVVKPDGSVAWLFDKGRVGAAGERRFMTGACTDVTERRLTEEALRQADREKDEFLGMVSHELRTPLSPMVVALSLLEKGDVRARARALEIMGRQVTRMRTLVDDLLDLSRVRLGRLELRRDEVDLRDVARHAFDAARPAIDARRHRAQLQVPDMPLVVLGDAGRLGQVVDNLLANATKYTPDGGRIELAVSTCPEHVQLRVRDSGIGIDPARVARVFELFEQEEAGRARSDGGLGIGLALVERLVRLHGGTVEARSAGLNRGSEFIVTLPRAPRAETS